MEEHNHIDSAEAWKETLNEIRSNWVSLSKEIQQEWQEQLKNVDSPLQRTINMVKAPSTMPEPIKEQILEMLTDLKTLADKGLDAAKDLLKGLQ